MPTNRLADTSNLGSKPMAVAVIFPEPSLQPPSPEVLLTVG